MHNKMGPYRLYWLDTGNLIGDYESETEALRCVWNMVRIYGSKSTPHMILYQYGALWSKELFRGRRLQVRATDLYKPERGTIVDADIRG